MHPMLSIAISAARAAGDEIVRQMDRLQWVKVKQKTKNNFVSEIDHMAESIIVQHISEVYPDHGFLCEESGVQGGGDYQWIVDPLDGTTNYLHGFPQFAVSIALKHKTTLTQAVIYDPLRQELFTASRGNGAFMDNRRIRVSTHSKIQGALLGTGFPFHDHAQLERYLESFKLFMPEAAGIRRAGAATLDLAYVACGRLDGFWEFALSPWDIAAGALLIEEAGGMVGELMGDGDYLTTGNIMAANARLFPEMDKLLKTTLTTETTN